MDKKCHFNIWNKLLICGLSILVLFTAACGTKNNSSDNDAKTEEVKIYQKTTKQIALQEGFQPYRVCYSEEGICYVAQTVLSEDDDYKTENKVFFQKNNEMQEEALVTSINDGIIRDISVNSIDGETVISVLWFNENEVHATGYTHDGKVTYDTLLDEKLFATENYSHIYQIANEELVLQGSNNVYKLSITGEIKSAVPVQGEASSIICMPGGSVYAVQESAKAGKNETLISKIDFNKQTLESGASILGSSNCVSMFNENSIAIWTEDYIYLFDTGNTEVKPIVDLTKQSILYSEIQCVSEVADGIQIYSQDVTSNGEVYSFTLSDRVNPKEDTPINDTSATDTPIKDEPIKETETKDEHTKAEYSEDGRPIVHVAVPEEYKWQIEYYGKKYNQLSEKYFVQIDRFPGPLSDYLGKGNRPDAVMLTDYTEINDYVKKGILADMNSLFDKQDAYSLNEIVPRVVDLLSVDGRLYGMSGRFSLLLRSSTKEEMDATGKCTPLEYFKWYDEYLNQKEIDGMGNLEAILYANLPYFYDEAEGSAFFTSNEFKGLMESYKKVLERSKKEKTPHLVSTYGYMTYDIFDGPKWYNLLSNMAWFGNPDNSMMGMPFMDGSSVDYMSLEYPISIMEYSDCQAGAFDFALYYCSQVEYLMNGSSTSDAGMSYTTYAPFSTFKEILRNEIYETDKPFAIERSSSGEMKELYFTDEMLNRIETLISSAKPETKTQKVVFSFLKEEMEDYYNGSKSLDKACDILQSRVSLYLMENE